MTRSKITYHYDVNSVHIHRMTSSFIWLCVTLHRAMITPVIVTAVPLLWWIDKELNTFITFGNCQLKFIWLAKMICQLLFQQNCWNSKFPVYSVAATAGRPMLSGMWRQRIDRVCVYIAVAKEEGGASRVWRSLRVWDHPPWASRGFRVEGLALKLSADWLPSGR